MTDTPTSATVKKIFTEDLQIRDALLRRDGNVTRQYFYQQCYPLFKSIFNRFFTDCENVKEFMDEIYVLILVPNKESGKCQLENFRGESTLASWLKTACLYYCYGKYKWRDNHPPFEPPTGSSGKNEPSGDRNDEQYGTIEIDFDHLNCEDAATILGLMPNQRYRRIIELRYLEQMTNEETAEALGMTMDNFYNKHKLAKAQYERVFRKEERNG